MTTLSLLVPSKKLKYRYKTPPYSHQKKALKKILDLGGTAALFMEMRTGKTKVAIDWAGIGFYNTGVRRVLVVAPLSVLGVWPQEIRKHGTAPARAFRLQGATDSRVNLLRQVMRTPADDKLTFVIINYEGIWRESTRGISIEKLLIDWRPDLVIFDESHRLKSSTSKQSRSAYRIAQEIPQRLILTGTPISKSPLDAFGQFRCVNDQIFGKNWYQFKNNYGVWGGFGRFQLRGYRNLPELIARVRAWSFRVRTKDCFDLPDKLYPVVPVTLSDKAIKMYREMAKEMIVEIEETHATASIVLVKLLRLSQMTSGFVKDVDGVIREFDDSKLRTCMDLLDDLLEETPKVFIVCRFVHDIQRLAGELTKKGIKYRILSGSVPGTQRDSFIQEFKADPEIKVFISQIQAGSLGIDLSAANVGIMYSWSYSALDYWQVMARLDNSDPTRKVAFYHLVVPNSIDSISLQVLKEKGQLAKAVLHNPQILLP
jgi:SNF2 family DNA or RNA helicase